MARLDYAHARAEMSGSIPRGVGGPPPPGLDPKRGKLMCIKVRMLDDSVAVFHLGHKALGQTLLDEVARHLNLLENDYFGLEFIDSFRNRCWLEKDKPILRQISALNSDAKFYFIVKFYSPNPVDLEEEYTRWLFTLQIRRDLAMGDLQCTESTAALLAAYLVQSDCGDFSDEDYPNASYLSHSRFIPNQTLEFQQKVMENHRNLIGMTPAESDLALLEVARRSEYYGIKFHAAKDIEGTDANLAVMHLGIKVFHQLHCVSTFSWAKIRKLSFKRKKLLIKLHPDTHQYYKETIEFGFETRNECKNFWKKCVEHHAFFRCSSVEGSKKDGKLFSKGSSFRYSGRTQKQLIDYVREHHKRREPFTRPLRSSCPSRGAYSTSMYSTVSDKKRNGRTHASMPHLPSHPLPENNSGTLDARTRRHSPKDRCTSDVDTDRRERHRPRERKRAKTEKTEPENISLSLPNVLSDDVHVVCQELDIESREPPKSASGDNFLELTSRSHEYDNVSEDSYRLSDNERSSRSEVSQQVYNTTFTTKRVGNVIVKRIVSQCKSTPATTDDEEGNSQSESLPTRRKIKEYPFNSTNMVPIEIDGPNVDMTVKPKPIYTSSGALLLKPKVISEDTPRDKRDSGNYSTIISPTTTTSVKAEDAATSTPAYVSLGTSTTPTESTTYGATRPYPGKVITKENMVITPEGVKEKVKPAVPPKPKKPLVPPHRVSPASDHPVVHMSGSEPLRSKSEEKERPEKRSTLSRPALISVQSEDSPDIQKCHLYTSDIPYTLTLRNVESNESLPFSTFREPFESHSLKRSNKSLETAHRRKSLDLVPRKRLPSPGNYSSQDHTINSSTGDGDVLEYLLRRRSMSHERSALSKRGRRGDPRRQTQPVRFDLPPSPCSPSAGGSTPFISFLPDDVTEDCVSESRSLHEDMDRLEKAQTQSMSSFNTTQREDSEDSDPLPPPPSTVRPPPPPPPPKPKDAANRVVEIKATTVLNLTTVVPEKTLEKNTDPEPVPEAKQETVKKSPSLRPEILNTQEAPKDSPPFIDDSPKENEKLEETPTSHRNASGLLWTDF